jgi:hypothetical protein
LTYDFTFNLRAFLKTKFLSFPEPPVASKAFEIGFPHQVYLGQCIRNHYPCFGVCLCVLLVSRDIRTKAILASTSLSKTSFKSFIYRGCISHKWQFFIGETIMIHVNIFVKTHNVYPWSVLRNTEIFRVADKMRRFYLNVPLSIFLNSNNFVSKFCARV